MAKKLVNSDFKNQRVDDPNQISARQEKQVKKYVTDYLEKAVVKKRLHDQRKAERKAAAATSGGSPAKSPATPLNGTAAEDASPALDGDERMMNASEEADTEMPDVEPAAEDGRNDVSAFEGEASSLIS